MIFELQKHYTLFILMACFLAACGDDSSSSASKSDKTVSGTVQGLIAKGATISVHELDEKLQQTGYTIESEATNDQGDFSIKAKDFTSQYALLKAEGYLRNDITGQKTSINATLYKFMDISESGKANINVLSHLAHKRAIYLVTKKHMSVAKAQKQAESEVLKSFGIEEDFDNTEDADLLEKQNAAMLAISVLMQGYLSNTDIDERLTNYASDIEKDGVWNDTNTITEIADWAYKQYLYSTIDKIESLLEDWNNTVNLSDFEKHVNHFWWHAYGLGNCIEKRKNEIVINTNEMSDYSDIFFICRPDIWRAASAKEKEKYFQQNPKDGDIRYDDDLSVCEVYKNGSWQRTKNSDCNDIKFSTRINLGICTSEREKYIKMTDYGAYVCNDEKWITFDSYIYSRRLDISLDDEILKKNIEFVIDTMLWKDAPDGTLRKGNATDIIYIFDNNAWRVATVPEAVLGKCTQKDLNVAGYVNFNKDQDIINLDGVKCEMRNEYYETCEPTYTAAYYKCTMSIDHETRDTSFYWDYAYKYHYDSPRDESCPLDRYDSVGIKLIPWSKGKDGESRWGFKCKKNCYVYENYSYSTTQGYWRRGDVTECLLGLGGCTSRRDGETGFGPTIRIIPYQYSCDPGDDCSRSAEITSNTQQQYVCDTHADDRLYDYEHPWILVK